MPYCSACAACAACAGCRPNSACTTCQGCGGCVISPAPDFEVAITGIAATAGYTVFAVGGVAGVAAW
ncbi:hypothetical protein [Dictyoglomus thermophilum]|jgi:hypothetical protein|uniref:Uncharacterized protein n=1 Tax=Dictyoglomus thermophilum (strain ATCC 35947 / DSM 3960 / H-6-12) TaxID=309799 RepID=B5YBB4_DICT6|nr:hypothetical protein [Dictyoglomus thermophilum]ACI19768.1 hypothetical protein DICTH_1831 [Dictyoglomus thermophilum H-6-12]